MSDLESQFEAAAVAAQNLPSKPDNETLLQLYALYKQGTTGDASGNRPGVLNFVGRAKFDAWLTLKGTPVLAAQEQYVALIARLQEEMG